MTQETNSHLMLETPYAFPLCNVSPAEGVLIEQRLQRQDRDSTERKGYTIPWQIVNISISLDNGGLNVGNLYSVRIAQIFREQCH